MSDKPGMPLIPLPPIQKPQIEDAIEAWLQSAQGKDCANSDLIGLESGSSGELRNRLRLAFMAGATWERRQMEAKP